MVSVIAKGHSPGSVPDGMKAGRVPHFICEYPDTGCFERMIFYEYSMVSQ